MVRLQPTATAQVTFASPCRRAVRDFLWLHSFARAPLGQPAGRIPQGRCLQRLGQIDQFGGDVTAVASRLAALPVPVEAIT